MSGEEFLGRRVVLHCGDSRDVLAGLADASVDSVVTDPPYALVSIVKRFGSEGAAPPAAGVYARSTSGFMGKAWDTGETAFAVEFWAQVFRVLKPGGHVIAASGTRTYHRLAVAIEDAGFEIRDMISWLYGSGFPKSHNQPGGWGTALKPACEPWVLARKPLIGTVAANVLAHGTGAINIDGCRIEGRERTEYGLSTATRSRGATYGEPSPSADFDSTKGRWPANVIHDGSDEVVAGFPDTRARGNVTAKSIASNAIWGNSDTIEHGNPGDAGSAARFFYSAKADANDRIGSKHPTVKPVDLMRYLCRLVTPPGGVVLDPFAGTGTTGEAAWREGFRCILIEREAEYAEDIRRRISLCDAGPVQRQHARLKARGEMQDAGPLFGGLV